MKDIKNRLFPGQEIGRKDNTGIMVKEGDLIELYGDKDCIETIIYNPYSCAFTFEPQYPNEDPKYWGAFAHDWGESQGATPEINWKIVGSIYN